MAVIKCKMCGGDLNLIEGQSVAECEYCGSRQTVPAADNEKKLTLFARANRLRSSCEFDKAAGVYETIVADFPEEAEAYWGLVLCKYGIEYVDDPATGRKIPTCHRSSFDSIMEDGDLEQAMENADAIARKVYREEAKQIEEIRKGIIAVSANEQPYDIFICYKESDANGDRTLDSVLAQDLYDALTAKGYRTFFARITLEDKLGQEYEPYIFAALNSAKIMLAVGTDYEYYNAVWVKNEWSRFLKLMTADKTKHLIPCYKGIDAYDMPKEFARLQAQDLGKMGAIQDILRGVEKLLPRQEAATVIQERVVVGGSGDNKIASLLDRGNMALEDGDWAKADSFFEDVLNNDSKNAQAYLGKTLAQEKCRTIDAFARKRKDASHTVRGETLKLEPERAHVDGMAKKFSLPGYVEQSEIRNLYTYDLSYHSDVAERKQQYRNEETYWANHKLLSRAEKFAVGAVAENFQREKKALFAALADRVKQAENAEAVAKQDVEKRYDAHLKRADEKARKIYNDGWSRREAYYQKLLGTAKQSSDIAELTITAKKFDQLGDYQDSRNLAEHCRKRAAEEQAKLDAVNEQQRLFEEKQKKAKKAKNKKIALISTAVAVVLIAALVVMTTVVIPNNNYKKAEAMLAAGQYEEAIAAFEALEGYKDSEEQIAVCYTAILDGKYEDAVALREAGNYVEAIAAFEALEGYKDSEKQILKCEYQRAVVYKEAGDYTEAIALFKSLEGYKDSDEQILECEYKCALAFMDTGDYIDAIAIFKSLKGYKDSAEQIDACNATVYDRAVAFKKDGNYRKALAEFDMLDGYKDSAEQINALRVQLAVRDTISTGILHTVGLKADGTVVTVGYNKSDQCDVESWSDIIAISAGGWHTVGLKVDGTVVAVGYNEHGQCDVKSWSDIIAISAGGDHTVGLKADGTVVAVGYNEYGQCDVKSWSDIIAISAGDYHTVGLKADGTVVAVGYNVFDRCDVESWSDIIAISAGDSHTVGLKSDGTVVAVGYNEHGQCDVKSWSDIIAISAGGDHTVGLKADGTVVAVGENEYGQCNVKSWSDIIAISAGGFHTIGLKADGTVVAVGQNKYGQCKVSGWKDIKTPETAE